MRNIIICILGIIIFFSVMINVIFVASTLAKQVHAATTQNLLSDDFSDTDKWSGTNQSARHGDNIIAFVDGGSVKSTVSLDDHLLKTEINTGFTTTLDSEVWYWNNTPNQTVTSKLTIVGVDGTTFEQNIVSEGICSSWNGCGYEDLGTNTIVIGSNTQSNFDLTSTFTATAPETSGHYAADLRLPELYVTYDEFSLTFDTDVTDIGSNIKENLSFDTFNFEEDFDFIFLEPVQTEMFIEIAPEMLDNYLDFGFDEMEFDEPMDMGMTFEEVPMEMPMDMYDDAPLMELYADDSMMTMYTDEPMPEEMLMPLPMIYEDEEMIVADEPEQENVSMIEEVIEEELTPTDEELEQFPYEPMIEEVIEEEIEETIIEDDVSFAEEIINIEETPSIELAQDEPSINVEVKFSDVVLADLKNINVIINSQNMILDKPFYKPQNIYTSQPTYVDNRQLYQNVAMIVDPIAINQRKLRTNRLKQNELLLKIERIKHAAN